ncbi:phosphotransferase family protein [Streptomyces sp. NPDC055089]
MDRELPLPGGRITPGVVRVGDTVRRPPSSSSAFVAALLTHLEGVGFAGAPHYLGTDKSGRDSFSYLPGWVPAKFQHWSDGQVAAAGRLLRSLHDATAGSSLAGRHPVVCHHDPGPNNCVFVEGRPMAFIDFDTAAPGNPLEDVGYGIWTWCVSSKARAVSVREQAAQVRILADAYGVSDGHRTGLIDAMIERQERNALWWQAQLTGPLPHVATPRQIHDRVAWSDRERAFVVAHRELFERALFGTPLRSCPRGPA